MEEESLNSEEILKKIKEINNSLDSLLTPQSPHEQGTLKPKDASTSFEETALNVAIAYPEILPSYFDLEKFKLDINLSKNLTAIANEIEKLHSRLQSSQLEADEGADNDIV